MPGDLNDDLVAANTVSLSGQDFDDQVPTGVTIASTPRAEDQPTGRYDLHEEIARGGMGEVH